MLAVDTSNTVTLFLLKTSAVFSCNFSQYAAILALIVLYFRIKYFPKIKHDIIIVADANKTKHSNYSLQ